MRTGRMPQALSFRPEMEPAAVAVGVLQSVVTFRKGRSSRLRVSNTCCFQSLLAKPTHACFCEEIEERQ